MEYLLVAIFAFLAGAGAGWVGFRRMPQKPSHDDIARYMASVVSREEAEALRRGNRLAMARAKRRTMRVDGGPKAKVHRMRVRKAPIRPL